MDKLKKDVIKIIEGDKLTLALEKLFKGTLFNYINFIEKYKYMNLNE